MAQQLAWSVTDRPEHVGAVPLKIEALTDAGAVRRLGPEWNALVEESGAQLFQRHELQMLWLEHFAPGAELRVLVAREPDGRLAAVLPLMPQECSVLGAEVKQLVSPADWHLNRCDLLARRPLEAACAFVEWLGRHADWDVMRVFNVPDAGAAWALHGAAQALGVSVGTVDSVRSPYLALPASVEALQAGLKSGHRSSLRRRRKRLEEQGRVTVERVEGGPGLDALFEEVFALEAQGWKGREGTAILQSPKTHGFYRELVRLAAGNGWLALYLLRLDGRLVAFDLGLVHRSIYFSLKVGYDEGLGNVSPGQLLTLETLNDCIRRGVSEVDFLGDVDVAKSQWTSTARPHANLVLFRSRLLGEAIYARNNVWLPKVMNRVMGWAR